MAVYFTSSVPHGNTEEIETPMPNVAFDRRVSQAEDTQGETEYVFYVPNLGEFASADYQEMYALFWRLAQQILSDKMRG